MTFKDNGTYYIRGIVSISPAIIDTIKQEQMCDSLHYALFTDVAQYLPWIKLTYECKMEVECR